MIKEPSKKYLRLLTYISGFFLSVHMAFPSYFSAQFLGQYLSTARIGAVYIISSIITILLIAYIPKIIRRFGLLKTITYLTIIDVLAVFPLVAVTNYALVITLFIAYYSLGFVIRYVLDIYLEKISDDRVTGNIRGIFLTFVNLAWLVSPWLASRLIADSGFSIIYLISAITLLPLLYIVIWGLQEKESHRLVSAPSAWLAFKKLWAGKNKERRDLHNILAADFFLQFFYAVMVVYMALYLHQTVGLSEIGIGIAFTVMLLPFVLFELPLGKIADKWLGEKEILTAGFLLIGLATIATAFIHTPTIWIWALVLFLTRAGAASVEIMKETYLFKKINEQDTDILSLSRNMQPLAYIAGAASVSVFLIFFPLQYVFLALGIITLFGIKYSLGITDTR